MNTLSVTKYGAPLKCIEFLQIHFSGTSTPLQDRSLNQEILSLIQHTHKHCANFSKRITWNGVISSNSC